MKFRQIYFLLSLIFCSLAITTNILAVDLKITDVNGNTIVIRSVHYEYIDKYHPNATTEVDGGIQAIWMEGDGDIIKERTIMWIDIDTVIITKEDDNRLRGEIVLNSGEEFSVELMVNSKLLGETDTGEFSIALENVRTIIPLKESTENKAEEIYIPEESESTSNMKMSIESEGPKKEEYTAESFGSLILGEDRLLSNALMQAKGQFYLGGDDKLLVTSEEVVKISQSKIQLKVNGILKEYSISSSTKICIDDNVITLRDFKQGDIVTITTHIDDRTAISIRKGAMLLKIGSFGEQAVLKVYGCH